VHLPSGHAVGDWLRWQAEGQPLKEFARQERIAEG
jgi:hypothetical protein